jgi:hypothetical protein
MSRASRPCSRPDGGLRGGARPRFLLHAFTLLAGLAGCAASRATTPAAGPLAAEPGHLAREPDAVALDPPAALPPALSRAGAGGVVALRVPVSREAIASLLRAFFEAWKKESLDDLVALLSPDAGPVEARSRGSHVLVEGWRQRMRSHEYGRLGGVEMIRPERIERWETDDTPTDGALERAETHPGEIAVRVPVEVPWMAGERLFGDTVVMVLRPEEGRLQIAAYGEVESR